MNQTMLLAASWLRAATLTLAEFATALTKMREPVAFVTAFGRRSKAVMRFAIRKRRAREVYGRICSRTLEMQRAMVEVEPAPPVVVDRPAVPPSME
jgi:hypothetical protein